MVYAWSVIRFFAGCDVFGKEGVNEDRDIRAGCIDGQMAAMIVVNGAKIIIVICAHKPLKKHR